MWCVLWGMIYPSYLEILIPYQHREPSNHLTQTTHACTKWVQSDAQYLGMVGWKRCERRGRWSVGGTGVSIYQNTPGKYSMPWLSVEYVCVLQKIKPGHLPIWLTYTSLQLSGEGRWNGAKVFHCSLYGQWLLSGGGGRRYIIKTWIIHPIWKDMAEGDTHGVIECRSNIFDNNN